MSDPDDVAACPHCDTASLTTAGTAYYCHNCNRKTGAPNYRPPRQERNTRRGLAKRLSEANPGDVGGGR